MNIMMTSYLRQTPVDYTVTRANMNPLQTVEQLKDNIRVLERELIRMESTGATTYDFEIKQNQIAFLRKTLHKKLHPELAR